MTVALTILGAALVGGVVFMLLERWQREGVKPAAAPQPPTTMWTPLAPTEPQQPIWTPDPDSSRSAWGPPAPGVTGTTTIATATRTTTVARPACGPGGRIADPLRVRRARRLVGAHVARGSGPRKARTSRPPPRRDHLDALALQARGDRG